MRIAFIILVFIHGLIHCLGFLKGFGLKEIKELTLPISKPLGLLWLIAAVLIILYGILYLTNTKYAWVFGITGIIISQILIVLFWKDAKFGTIPNLVILVVTILSYGEYKFQKLVQNETSHLLAQNEINGERIVTENDINELPGPVKKWLRNTGIVGKPYISRGKIWQEAQIKLKPDQEKWFKASAIQNSTIEIPAFIWTVDVEMNGMINFRGRDKFEDGKGEMLIKLNALINIVNEKGDKLSEGSLQRFLGEMVWMPSQALSPYITWKEINDSTAIATMAYKGTTGSGTFHFNAEGDFIRFSAMRYMENNPDSEKYEWVLSVEGYDTFEGIRVPSKMNATWKLEEADWTWLILEIVDINYNEIEGL